MVEVTCAVYNKIYAIKAVREGTSLSLKASKYLVEALQRGEAVRFTFEQLARVLATVSQQGNVTRPEEQAGQDINEFDYNKPNTLPALRVGMFRYPDPVKDVDYFDKLD